MDRQPTYPLNLHDRVTMAINRHLPLGAGPVSAEAVNRAATAAMNICLRTDKRMTAAAVAVLAGAFGSIGFLFGWLFGQG